MTVSGSWDELVSAALLGTERRPYAPPRPDDELAALVAEAGDLAGAASAVWAYREVGRLPSRDLLVGPVDSPAGAPAAFDDRHLLPEGAVRSLAAIVGEPGLRSLIGEWLGLAAGDGRRLPPEWLPVLLDLTPDRHRPSLFTAGGRRAAWLAAQRPDWASGGSGPAAVLLAGEELAGRRPPWVGSDDDRLGAFALVRAAEPAAARRLAGRVWADEPPIIRAAMVAGLAEGLSVQDEPFLEERLDDRRKEVRRAAAELLGRLPASRFAGRMAARARAGVRFDARGRLRIDPSPDASSRRDAVTATSAQPDQWLLQVVGSTPLETWSAPDRMVGAAVRQKAAALLAAWSLAAERQADGGWARRLLMSGAPPTAGLLSVVTPEERDAFLVGWLGRVPLGSAVDVLGDLPAPWTAAVTDAVMAALASLVLSGDQSAPAAAVRDALPRVAVAADPGRSSAAAGVAAAMESLPDERRPAARLFWGRSVTSMNALVHFRQAMHQEFLDR